MRKLILALIPFALVLSAHAQEEKGKRPCKADVEKFCKDVQPGGGRILKCLMEHKEDLSAECKAHGEQGKKRMKEAHQACEGDIAKLCKDVEPGKGRILKCLKEHKGELSESCKAEFEGMRAKRGRRSAK